jgi:hypothetical protein
MDKEPDTPKKPEQHEAEPLRPAVVIQPTPQFRRTAWVRFQRALDPIGRPRPLPAPKASMPRPVVAMLKRWEEGRVRRNDGETSASGRRKNETNAGSPP